MVAFKFLKGHANITYYEDLVRELRELSGDFERVRKVFHEYLARFYAHTVILGK